VVSIVDLGVFWQPGSIVLNCHGLPVLAK